MRNLIGLLIVALIAIGAYRLFFSELQHTGTPAPVQAVDVVGVKNDLLAIAQAERLYQAQHGTYGSLEDLTTSGAMTIARKGRDGFTYEIEASGASFRVVARCPGTTSPGCTSYAVDQTMEVQASP